MPPRRIAWNISRAEPVEPRSIVVTPKLARSSVMKRFISGSLRSRCSTDAPRPCRPTVAASHSQLPVWAVNVTTPRPASIAASVGAQFSSTVVASNVAAFRFGSQAISNTDMP
jgi:hypothetical protein